MSFSYMIGDYLQRFEITSCYTSSFTDELVRCDPEHMFYFKKFCDHINNDAVLRPYRYYMGHNQTGSCQLEYYGYDEGTDQPNNKFFKLFYLFPYNKTHDMIRVYNETVDFKNWNFLTDGEFVEFIDANLSNINFYLTPKEPYWTTGLAEFGSQNESRVFTNLYPVLGKYDPANDRNNMLQKVKKIKKKSKINQKSYYNKNNPTQINDLYQKHSILSKRAMPYYINKSNEKYSRKDSISNFIDKIKELFFYYEKKIMNLLFHVNEDEFYFARSIEEALNKSRLNHKNIKEFPVEDNDTIVVSNAGSSFFTESLYVILKQKRYDKDNHYIITDYMYNVLIEKDMGAVYPKKIDLSIPVFPNISDLNSTMWNSVEKEIINVPIDVPLLVNVSSSIQYMIIKRIINTRSRYSFYIIMLFEINQKILEIYSLITNVFILCLVFLLVVFYVIRSLVFYTEFIRNRKLKNKQKAIASCNFTRNDIKTSNFNNPYKGKVTEAIDNLRMIQLMNSDDIKLNNSIDYGICEMTKNEEDLFNSQFEDQIQMINKHQSSYCPFCSYLIEYDHDLSILKYKDVENRKKKEKENTKEQKILNFYLNNNHVNEKKKENKNIYSNLYSKESQLFYIWKIKMQFNLNYDDLLKANPQKYLVLKFMKFIQKQNLLFAEIYPDLILSFIINFTKENIFSYHCKIKSFSLLKKLIKHNFKFWLKSKLDIFILFLALILRNSKIKKADDIIYYFIHHISYQNDYFINILKVLIDETSTHFTMEVYGKLFNRTQSPDFSVTNNIKDTVLFMKSLLLFADFAPYLTEYEHNAKCLNEINEIILTKEEKENQKFVSSFHLEMTKSVVLPWLNLMNSLSPKFEISNTINKNIDFWHNKISTTKQDK